MLWLVIMSPNVGATVPGEAYQALVSFLDENDPSWRASLGLDMTKAVRGDGKASAFHKPGFNDTECLL